MDERIRSFITDYGLILILAAAGVVFFAFGLMQLNNTGTDAVQLASDSLEESADTREIYVDVSGAVVKPGIYSLAHSARVADAIKLAGGMAENADTGYVSRTINMAQVLQDGQKIFIPTFNQSVAGAETQQAPESPLININTSSESMLDTLPGVGAVTAQKIIAGRPYATVDELKTKKSVTSATFEKIKDRISVY